MFLRSSTQKVLLVAVGLLLSTSMQEEPRALIQPFPPRQPWSALGITQTVADQAHRPLAFDINGELIASNDTGRVKTEVSSDHMRTWVTIASPTLRFPIRSMIVTQTGVWIANAGSSLYRSADAGTTWTRVLDLTNNRPSYENAIGILANGFAQSAAGVVYAAVYTITVGGYVGGQAPVYASADDGQTWTVHSTFPTSIGNVNPPGPTTVRHLHGMAALPSGLWLLTGDVGLEAGFWHWEQQQWVRKSPPDTDFERSQRWRAVSVQEREGFLYWGRDSGGGTPGEIGYAPVSDLARYQQLASVQTSVHFSTQMRNGLLLFGGSVEGGSYQTDAVVRVWAVDHSNQVYEVFAVAKSTDPRVRNDYAKIYNFASSPWYDSVAFGTMYTDPTQAKGVEVSLFPPRQAWSALGITQTVADQAHRPLAFDINGELIASNDTGRVKTEVSSDHMQTWVTIASPTLRFPIRSMIVTQTGVWIANAGSSLYRSADAGTTWTRVLDLTANRLNYENVLGILANGFAQSAEGIVYAAVYTTAVGGYVGGQAPVYASADDGATWTVHSTFPTSIGNVNPPGPTTVRNLQGMAALPSGLWLLTGDVGLEAGFWHWEPQRWVRKSPPDTDFEHSQRWRAVSVQERDGFLYWGRDSGGGTPGEIGYAPVSDLAHYQQLASLQTSVHFSTQMRNGLLLFGGSVEGGPYQTDAVVRVWAVDHSNQVYEVFAVAKSTDPRVRNDYAKIYNFASSPWHDSVAFGTMYTDPTQARGVEGY